jgi:hypothetical protein
MLSQMMERKIGASFEYGLTNIKSLAERDYERRLTSGFESDSTAVNP